MKRILLAIALLLGVSSVDAGSFESGNTLLSNMKNCDKYDAGQETYDNYFSCGAVVEYIIGVHDAYSTFRGWEGFDAYFCKP